MNYNNSRWSMYNMYFKIILSLIFVLNNLEAVRILGIFPFPATSHYSFNYAIMRTLADAGHRVTVASPIPPKNSNEVHEFIDTRVDKSKIVVGSNVTWSYMDTKRMSWAQILILMSKMNEENCKHVLDMKEIREYMVSSSKQFDVMFIQMLPMYECYLPIAKALRVPVIATLSFRPWADVDHVFGNPHPYVYPHIALRVNHTRMDFWERCRNVYNHLKMSFVYGFLNQLAARRIYDQFRFDYDLANDKRLSLLFSDNHPCVFPKAVAPNVIEIGGVHIKPSRPLPSNLQKFIDEAEHGVIVASLGTIAGKYTIDTRLKNIFRDAFAEIPQRVIWKFDDEVENLPSNVLLIRWMPQRDILAHDNVKAFVTHCGMSGTYETIHTGKPTIMIPVFLDQPSNAAMLEKYRVGVYLDILTLDKDELVRAITTVVNDPSYKKNMQELSIRFNDRPMMPQQSIIYWTEYVVKHNGATHLRPITADMPFYQYFLIDIILFVVFVIIVIYIIFRNILKLICHVFCSMCGRRKQPYAKKIN